MVTSFTIPVMPQVILSLAGKVPTECCVTRNMFAKRQSLVSLFHGGGFSTYTDKRFGAVTISAAISEPEPRCTSMTFTQMVRRNGDV